jgi:hypothetical protein
MPQVSRVRRRQCERKAPLMNTREFLEFLTGAAATFDLIALAFFFSLILN